MEKYIHLNGISQKLFIEAFDKVNKIPLDNFKNGETMIIETGSDSNWKLRVRFVKHHGNKDWSLEYIDILDK